MLPSRTHYDQGFTGAAARWRYSFSRAAPAGTWSVTRDDGEVGGSFRTLSAAMRFVASDLETLVLARPRGAS